MVYRSCLALTQKSKPEIRFNARLTNKQKKRAMPTLSEKLRFWKKLKPPSASAQ
jgi:hypothetical protein